MLHMMAGRYKQWNGPLERQHWTTGMVYTNETITILNTLHIAILTQCKPDNCFCLRSQYVCLFMCVHPLSLVQCSIPVFHSSTHIQKFLAICVCINRGFDLIQW